MWLSNATYNFEQRFQNSLPYTDVISLYITGVSTRQNLSLGFANNKVADQHRLISAFVIRFLESISKLDTGEISIF